MGDKAKILFVDDDPEILASFRRALRRRFVVDTALGPIRGLEAVAERGPYAVVVSDLRMPGLDGPGALRRIRETPGPNDATPILAFTADADAGLAQLRSLGFQDVVAKPLEPHVLIGAVAQAAAFDFGQERMED